MKKIVTLAAIAALAGGMIFADEPVAESKIVEFSGNASVEWGVDLDAGKTGFKNSTDTKMKVTLWNEGTKETSSDNDIWGELQIKTKAATIENSVGKDALEGIDSDAAIKPSVEKAVIHIFKFYVGIKEGDTVTGEYKFDGAIRSADNDNAKWISNVGPADYTQGIVAGYADDNLDIGVDFRTRKGTNTYWTNDYAIALEAQLKDSNAFVPGLFAKVGGSVNLTDEYFDNDGKTGKATRNFNFGKVPTTVVGKVVYFDDVSYHVWGYSAQAGYKLALDDTYYVKPAVAFTGKTTTTSVNRSYTDKNNEAGKAIAGQDSVTIKYDEFTTTMNLAFGAIFGWGETKDDNAGVPYLDGDMAKKVTPGVSVVVGLPLFTQNEISQEITWKEKDATKFNATSYKSTTKTTSDSAVVAVVTPSFFSGDLVENLKVGLYSEMAFMRGFDGRSAAEKTTTTKDNTKKSDGTPVTTDVSTIEREVVSNGHSNPVNANNAFALALGVKYDFNLDNGVKVTPQFGLRFANGSYFDNNINAKSPLSSNKVFEEGWGKMGVQRKVLSNGYGAKNTVYAGDFLNLKLRADVAGLVDNTTFYAEYASANLLNDINYKDEYITANGDKSANPYFNKGKDGWSDGWYNVRAGQFTVGTKISF